MTAVNDDKIKVMVVEDSAYMRYVITEILESDPGITVIDKAKDGLDALAKLKLITPDVITLDIQMPNMDGLSFLAEMRKNHHIPTVMISSLTREGAEDTFKALDLGAVDFIPKPSGSITISLDEIHDMIIQKVKMAADVKPRPIDTQTDRAPAPQRERTQITAPATLKKVIAIGSSTGGPRALAEIVSMLPEDLPACVMIVQHMPPKFTTSLAERLHNISDMTVSEAKNGDKILPGRVYVAPGNFHMYAGKNDVIYLGSEPPVHGVRPSVDYFFKSVADVYGSRVLSVVLTGMGSDGSDGIQHVKKMGGTVYAEHESTCVVYGMPRAAAATGCVDRVLILPRIADEIINFVES